MIPTIETERLILRPFTLSDAPQTFLMNSDPAVMKYIPGEHYQSVEEVRKMIQKNVLDDYEKYGFGRLAITLKTSNDLIGFTGLKYNDDFEEVDLGYRLIKKYWGQGIATEASGPALQYGFDQLEMKRIVALAYEENTGSVNIMKKLDMVYEKKMIVDGDEFVCYVKNG